LRIPQIAAVGNLQRDLAILDRVMRGKYRGKTPFAKASQNSVFVEPPADTQVWALVTFITEDSQGGWHWHLVGCGTNSLDGLQTPEHCGASEKRCS
jgi:hypothetical protein